MKTKKIFLAFVMTALVFTSCNNDDDGNGGENLKSVQFVSTIIDLDGNARQLRATGSVWDKNDAIGVYMVKNGLGLTPETVLTENKQHITENGTANGTFKPADAASLINYPDDGSKVDFIAYYPYASSGIVDYKYPINVSDQSSQPAIDFLYSNSAINLDKTTLSVPLGFKHKLSKVIFNITSEDISDLSGLSIAIKGMKTKAIYNLAGGENPLIVDGTSVSDMNAKVLATGGSGEAIILPETGVAGRSFVFSLPSGDSFVWEIPATTEYEEGKKYTYNVTLKKSGSGSVSVNPEDVEIEDWTDGPSENIVPEEEGAVKGKVELDKLYGYAEGTTGGEGGAVLHFNDGIKFRDWLKLREKNKSTDPAIVWLSGTFTKDDGRDSSSPWFDIKRTSNISIFGVSGFRMENVGFFLNEAENIIIRNLYIVQPKADNGADGISMQKSNRVWVDHCTFESVNQVKDYEDGSVDVTHGTKNVTISWNHFIKTQKTSLVGHSNSETGDSQITVTYHHNFFDQSSSRHPRVRFGKAHVYNNFYKGVTTYGAGSAYGAMVLVENNYFDNVHLPTDICTYPAKSSGSNLQGSVAGYLFASDNEYANIPAKASDPYPFTNVEYIAYGGEKLAQPLTRNDFLPTYSYIVDYAGDINSIVPAGAGAGKLPNFATAPIDVNNGGMPDTENPGGEDGEKPEVPGTDLGRDWSAINLGDDSASGVNTVGADLTSLTMIGKGKFESGKQTFSYVYKEITGDFEITAQLDSYVTSATSNQSEAGLLFAPSLATSGTDFLFAFCALGGNNSYNHSYRLTTGSNATRGAIGTAENVAAILKLRRVGNTYYSSYSTDGGITFSSEKSGTFTNGLPDTLYVGLLVNSGSNTETATAKFSNIKINGESVSFAD